MIVAGVVIQTRPGAASTVALGLQNIPGMTIHGGDGRSQLAAVWRAANTEALERLSRELVAGSDDIVGVFPTFVGEADDE